MSKVDQARLVMPPLRGVRHGRGSVISSLHRRHRTIEFKKFQAKISSRVVAPALAASWLPVCGRTGIGRVRSRRRP
jgi:hypothetical protein